MFYGYPAELIAERCCVAISAAFAYKSGRLRPRKPAAKLSRLLRDRVVRTAEWRGWFVTRNAIIDPEGNETPRGLHPKYYLILQFCGELVLKRGTSGKWTDAEGPSRPRIGEPRVRVVEQRCPVEKGAAPPTSMADSERSCHASSGPQIA
jgi:hypothetical protein